MSERENAFSFYHPWVNFAFFLFAIGFGVAVQHPAYVAAGVLCGGTYHLLLNGRKGLRSLALLLPLFLVVTGVNPLFNTEGEHILFLLFGRPYTLEALLYGAAIAGIFLNMALWFGCCSRILTSDRLLCLFGSRLPALSLLVVMVLRLIPDLFRRGRQISDARAAIGKTADRLPAAMAVLTALSGSALENSVITADSMRSRGYGGRRSSFQVYRFTRRDAGLLAVTILLFSVVLSGALTGALKAEFTPVLSVTPVTGGNTAVFGAYCLALLLPSILTWKEALVWRVLRSKI